MAPDSVLSLLGKSVRERRLRRGLTLKELAARTGLSPRFLVQVESGSGNISVRNLAGLAAALGTSAGALLSSAEAPAGPRVIALLGLRGAGKTTIGRRLARKLRRPFVELDHRIEEAAGLSLGEIFSVHGEDYYRRLEGEALDRVLADDRPLVLATGGGIVTSPGTWSRLRDAALTVWLRAEPQDHWNRVREQGDRRPITDRPQAMAELRRRLAAREPFYAQASRTVDTSRLGVDRAVRTIEGFLPG
jgi:XRE family transcriptional regulator, aerobic/anaerobic benzoate catabolism transcriptional regulator